MLQNLKLFEHHVSIQKVSDFRARRILGFQIRAAQDGKQVSPPTTPHSPARPGCDLFTATVGANRVAGACALTAEQMKT